MTATSEAIEAQLRGTLVHLRGDDELRRLVVAPLRADPQRGATIAALVASGTAQRLLRGTHGATARALVEMIGGSLTREDQAQSIRGVLRESQPPSLWLFDACFDLHNSYRRFGWAPLAAATGIVTPVVPTDPSAAFTGMGATGISPTQLSIPLEDQWSLLRGDRETDRLYRNPSTFTDDLRRMTQEQRRRQGQILTGLPISTVVPDSYLRLPSRLAILEAAAQRHNLHKELIAAFLLAELRDQSQREDAAEYLAAWQVYHDGSIGLGQVKISTARDYDLFADTLSSRTRTGLGHQMIAVLLASDEFNIFASAKYIRIIADMGAAAADGSVPGVRSGGRLDLAAYVGNSRGWPRMNIAALGSEYTSLPWDGVFSGWGGLVLASYDDLMGHSDPGGEP